MGVFTRGDARRGSCRVGLRGQWLPPLSKWLRSRYRALVVWRYRRSWRRTYRYLERTSRDWWP